MDARRGSEFVRGHTRGLGCNAMLLTQEQGLGPLEENIRLKQVALEHHHWTLGIPWLVARDVIQRRELINAKFEHVKNVLVMHSTKNQVVRALLVVRCAGKQPAIILAAKELHARGVFKRQDVVASIQRN